MMEEDGAADAGSARILSDLVDYEAELIFAERSKRIARWVTLNFFWNLHPARGCTYGRLYLRRYMAEILVKACGGPPLGLQEGTASEDSSRAPLAQWAPMDWNELVDDLKNVRSLCIRKDAHLILEFDTDNVDEETDPEVMELPYFGKKFDILQRCIEVNSIVSPIRWDIEQQIMAATAPDTMQTPPRLSKKSVAEVVNLLEATDDAHIVNAVESFFVGANRESEKLKSLVELREILDQRPFNLNFLQEKIETTLRRWSGVALGTNDPVLFHLRYGIPPRSSLSMIASTPTMARRPPKRAQERKKPPPNQEMERLRESRQNLGEGHGEDPLEDSRKIAAAAVGAATPPAAAAAKEEPSDEEVQGKSKRRLLIDDILDADDEDDENERVTLSSMPRKRARRISRKFAGPPPDDGIFDEEGKVKSRRKWTEEEKEALRQGVRKHGIGKWAEIKREYADMFRNRTSVQIKDCWRTMSRKEEV